MLGLQIFQFHRCTINTPDGYAKVQRDMQNECKGHMRVIHTGASLINFRHHEIRLAIR